MIRKRNIKFLLIRLAAFFGFINFNIYLAAQAPLDREYKAVAENRANKIVVRLGITDSSAFYKVRDIIAEQYIDLKNIHENRDAQIKAIKETNGISNQSNPESKIQLVQQNADNQLEKLHKAYMSKLSQHLSAAQVEKVKDGMTYGVLPITYKGYLEMIPRLSNEEKKFIYDALVEAREHAMDAERSEKKHGWFGKYKGRINNYLSGRGYDMNKESKEWQERIKKQEKK